MFEHVPLLMRPHEIVGVKAAADFAGRSDKTIRRWIGSHGIARQSCANAPLDVHLPALLMVMHKDWPALEMLRAGRRSVPEVRRYFDFLGFDADEPTGHSEPSSR